MGSSNPIVPLTKVGGKMGKDTSRDRPAEIEVTEAMKEAGIAALYDSGVIQEQADPSEAVASIFSAMARVSEEAERRATETLRRMLTTPKHALPPVVRVGPWEVNERFPMETISFQPRPPYEVESGQLTGLQPALAPRLNERTAN